MRLLHLARAGLGAGLLATGCENSLLDRSLVFATHTTIGMEVSVSPAETTAPVSLILGYKRSEGVLNPVYHSEGVVGPVTKESSGSFSFGSGAAADGSAPSSYQHQTWSESAPVDDTVLVVDRYRARAYSVIAKIASDAGANAGKAAEGNLAVAQWFATGEAATLLAAQPGIAGAVVGSGEVADAAALQATGFTQGLQALEGTQREWGLAQLVLIYRVLALRADEQNDAEAAAVLARLDRAAPSLPDTYAVVLYAEDSGDVKNFTTVAKDTKPVGTFTSAFRKAITYAGELQNVATILEEKAFTRADLNLDGSPVTAPQVIELKKQQSLLEKRSKEIVEQINENEAVDNAVRYYRSLL